jgi:RNA polymerase sigma-70 factor (ECF subfamily)
MESEPEALKRRFTDLYERHYGSIYAFAARRIGRQFADEIAAETFLIAWRRFDTLPAAPLPWLYGTARNVLARQRDAAARDGRTLDAIAVELAVAGGTASDSGSGRRLADAWEKLSERDREVLALVAWEELSVAEAAAVLDCPAPVFSVRLHRARGRLAKLLAGAERESSSMLSEARS